MPIIIAVLGLAVLQAMPTPTPASAALSPNVADERCLATFAYLASEPGQGASAAQAGRYGMSFFYGKLMGRDPGVDLGAALRGVVADIAAVIPAEAVRCRREVEAAGQAMGAAGTAARPTPVEVAPIQSQSAGATPSR